MTTDLQRLHQDEWLSALRIAEQKGTGPISMGTAPFCALGHALDVGQIEPMDLCKWLGISWDLRRCTWQMNDGVIDAAALVISPVYVGPPRSLTDIADWFKEQRDLYGGDLSHWVPAS